MAVHQRNQQIRAGGILFDLESHQQSDCWLGEFISVPSPYMSTFLSLRNKQVLLDVIHHFQDVDLLLVEGAGKQHPRYFGLACEIGVDLDIPTIGITKSSLWGEIDFSHSLYKEGFNYNIFPVYDKTLLIAYFIKKIGNKRGIFVSIGHKISLETTLDIILALLVYRIPEPLRLVKKLLKEAD
ncbi:MAG: endonuclease V [Candidatus Heimdallarchaeota archaeon]|nr:MAG: endonuclease V [Candidatus Heimdallarchaeota archaeon]